jgi:hypothetical protein
VYFSGINSKKEIISNKNCMYITKIHIKNVRSLKNLTWEIDETECPGWHVIIGDNGSGKSTFLRAISLTFVFNEFEALRLNKNDWLNREADYGNIDLELVFDKSTDTFSGKGNTPYRKKLPASLKVARHSNQKISIEANTKQHDQINPNRHIWGDANKGWFSAAYGPFRRFTGGDKDYQKLFYTHPKLAAHLSIFGEDVALTESLEWLKQLKFKQLENKSQGDLLDLIISFVNSTDFLPYNASISDVSSEGVKFIDGNGYNLPVEELSDGYRSILSMTFELIRQLVRAYDTYSVFDYEDPTIITASGVVLIDEIDVHLHPTWQRRIGLWFRKHFPHIQFIVTTHSPLICQAATIGTVYRLPKPGTNDEGAIIQGKELDRLLYGNILDAYGTEAFGENVTRSEESKQKLQELAQLNQKARYQKLTPEETVKRSRLQMIMPTNPDVLGEV